MTEGEKERLAKAREALVFISKTGEEHSKRLAREALEAIDGK